MSQCKDIREKLSQYLDHRLGQEDSHLVEEHLSICAECRKELNQLLELQESLKSIPKVEALADFEEKLNTRIKKRKSLNRFLKDLVRNPALGVPVGVCVTLILLFAVFRFTNIYQIGPAYRLEKDFLVQEDFKFSDTSRDGFMEPMWESRLEETELEVGESVKYGSSYQEFAESNIESLKPLSKKNELQPLPSYTHDAGPLEVLKGKKDVSITQAPFDKIMDIHIVNNINLAEALVKVKDTLSRLDVKVLTTSGNFVGQYSLRIELDYDRLSALIQELSVLDIGVISLPQGIFEPPLDEYLLFTLRLIESTKE